MVARPRARLLASGIAALAVATVVGGCGARTDDTGLADANPSRSQTAESSPAASATQSATPEESSSPGTTPEATQTPQSATAQTGLRGRLLTAEEMPGFNEQYHWMLGKTRVGEAREPFGTCHKYAMTSIGAERVVTRGYVSPSTDSTSTADNLVAEFADEMTARRAYEVLKSWRGQCDEELTGYDRQRVGPLESVSVGGGAVGDWYLLTYGPAENAPDSGYFDAQGITRDGNRISVIELKLVGQDYTYPAGKEPMVEGVRTAAQKLG